MIIRNTWKVLRNPLSGSSLELDFFIPSLNLAIENLRKMAGWSLNSSMPYLYANRFISENANKLNIQRIGNGVCQHSCHPYLNQATETSLALTRLDRRTGLRAVG